MLKLTHKAAQELKCTSVQMKIALDCNRTLQTVSSWIKHGHDNLSKRGTIESITKHTKLDETEIFD
jgi:hypothetical protein